MAPAGAGGRAEGPPPSGSVCTFWSQLRLPDLLQQVGGWACRECGRALWAAALGGAQLCACVRLHAGRVCAAMNWPPHALQGDETLVKIAEQQEQSIQNRRKLAGAAGAAERVRARGGGPAANAS